MYSNLDAQTIKLNRPLLTGSSYVDDKSAADTRHAQALVMVKLLHELLHHFVPPFLRSLYQPLTPCKTPPSSSTPEQIQTHKVDGQDTQGRWESWPSVCCAAMCCYRMRD